MATYGNPKIDRLLDEATALDMTEQDFADLAIAAADQAILDEETQFEIRRLIDAARARCAAALNARQGKEGR